MIAEFFLGLISIGLIIAFIGYVWLTNKEKAKLVNALMSKDAQELFNLEMTDKVKVTNETVKPDEMDGTPIEDIPDDEYYKLITKEGEDTGNGE